VFGAAIAGYSTLWRSGWSFEVHILGVQCGSMDMHFEVLSWACSSGLSYCCWFYSVIVVFSFCSFTHLRGVLHAPVYVIWFSLMNKITNFSEEKINKSYIIINQDKRPGTIKDHLCPTFRKIDLT
jgi:hypothetical protein